MSSTSHFCLTFSPTTKIRMRSSFARKRRSASALPAAVPISRTGTRTGREPFCAAPSRITPASPCTRARTRKSASARLTSATWSTTTSMKCLSYDGMLDLAKAAIQRLGCTRGMDLDIHCDAPPGSGLGGSSALVSSVIGAVASYQNKVLDNYELGRAELSGGAQRPENSRRHAGPVRHHVRRPEPHRVFQDRCSGESAAAERKCSCRSGGASDDVLRRQRADHRAA